MDAVNPDVRKSVYRLLLGEEIICDLSKIQEIGFLENGKLKQIVIDSELAYAKYLKDIFSKYGSKEKY